jgi:hypothetical protein
MFFFLKKISNFTLSKTSKHHHENPLFKQVERYIFILGLQPNLAKNLLVDDCQQYHKAEKNKH